MPSASEFSLTPDSNSTIGGTNVAEGCSPAGINQSIRYLASVARDTYDRLPAAGAAMPVAGGAFTGDIIRQGRGGYLHHVNAAQPGGQVHFLLEGSARPAPAEGTVVFYYS